MFHWLLVRLKYQTIQEYQKFIEIKTHSQILQSFDQSLASNPPQKY